MKDLRRILESLGYRNIRTHIQSGNVVLRSHESPGFDEASEISDAVAQAFGFRPDVQLIEAAEFRSAVERNPFPCNEGKLLHFAFVEQEPVSPDLDSLDAIRADSEQFKLDGRVFYLYTPEGFGKSRLAERFERALGVSATARNYNTVSRLLSMLNDR